ncbi:TMEM38B, partial [Cervus elaphus hippelaphus]
MGERCEAEASGFPSGHQQHLQGRPEEPEDEVPKGYSFLPVQLLAAGMKEVTRTWKIVGGVTHANSYYKNGWIVMIAIGWARVIFTFQQTKHLAISRHNLMFFFTVFLVATK